MSQVKMLNANRQMFSMFIMLTQLWLVWALPRTDPPILPSHPFSFIWNAPTELCDIRYGKKLDLSFFQFVSSTLKTATNQNLSLFYIDRFGIFPYVNEETGLAYDDGLPQLIDIHEHHELAEDDIEYYIPVKKPGFAVLDFEEWRPQWDRNWGSKDIYRQISISVVRKKNPWLSEKQVKTLAKISFERAAKRYFLRSIGLGKTLRPKRLWGYYLFPDCYNYDYNQNMAAFNGECPDIEKRRNDELQWLWDESTALYPSIYLELVFKNAPRQARLYVRHRIQETMRISLRHSGSYSIPIYAFIRPLYKNKEDEYMSEINLVNTIGEAAALGAAGVVSWGNLNLTDKEDACIDALQHLDRVMNPYILNVSTATQLCSKALCSGRGRCVRKQWDTDVFLHLNPQRYRIYQKHYRGRWTVAGRLSQSDVHWFNRHFDCMCYSRKACRSVIYSNKIEESAVTGNGADKAGPLLSMMLLCLMCARHGI
ncbi:hyaluronidase-5-like [Brachionichthys hirsutus]|uniref:hyaluronidase-5-like n=1 Tax=Brachionichthys hirsutus TaxID=412623 RepID=UPI003604DFCC